MKKWYNERRKEPTDQCQVGQPRRFLEHAGIMGKRKSINQSINQDNGDDIEYAIGIKIAKLINSCSDETGENDELKVFINQINIISQNFSCTDVASMC